MIYVQYVSQTKATLVKTSPQALNGPSLSLLHVLVHQRRRSCACLRYTEKSIITSGIVMQTLALPISLHIVQCTCANTSAMRQPSRNMHAYVGRIGCVRTGGRIPVYVQSTFDLDTNFDFVNFFFLITKCLGDVKTSDFDQILPCTALK